MGNTKFGKHTTAIEALDGADLTGKAAIVTGGNSGIGVETCRALAHAGADVVMTSRSVEVGEKVAKELQESGVKGGIEVMQLDLADLASVKRFADSFLASGKRLDLLVLNAGVMACPQGYTKDGFELQTGTNHFGHFYLTQLLLPKLKTQGTKARLVAVSSVAHRFGTVDLEDVNWRRRKYSSWAAYGQSKLANILFVKELARRMQEEGAPVAAFSLHPGAMFTNLQRYQGGLFNTFFAVIGPFIAKSVPAGAATTIVACVDPELESQSGAYLSDCHVATPNKEAQDGDKAKKLWELSERLVQQALEGKLAAE